ncbi:MAG: DUF3825 domain-containing protein [Gemmataceae bacterium]|nr:DUF3825 domain-containing protein [Gemmataceae bacterium]
MEDSWFVARNKQKDGPFSLAQLREQVAAGHLLSSNMVLLQGALKWDTAAASVPGLFPSSVPGPEPTATAFPRTEEGQPAPPQTTTSAVATPALFPGPPARTPEESAAPARQNNEGVLKNLLGNGTWGYFIPDDGTRDLHFSTVEFIGARPTQADIGRRVAWDEIRSHADGKAPHAVGPRFLEDATSEQRTAGSGLSGTGYPAPVSTTSVPETRPCPVPQKAPGPKRYESLYKRYPEQPSTEVFSVFPSRGAGSWETPYRQLAAMTDEPDKWNFVRKEFQRPGMEVPILTNYLNFTFLRVQEQERIRYSPDHQLACFNTGLSTPEGKDIFATFEWNVASQRDRQYCEWISTGFFDSYADWLSVFQPLPEAATYIDDSSDLVLDLSYEIDVGHTHILNDKETQGRLPAALRDNRTLALNAIEGATKFLKQKASRNYKLAIPFWYVAKKKIQLLLPLCLMGKDADVALIADKDKAASKYRIRTVLPMDKAYINARLLTKPDRDWLNP